MDLHYIPAGKISLACPAVRGAFFQTFKFSIMNMLTKKEIDKIVNEQKNNLYLEVILGGRASYSLKIKADYADMFKNKTRVLGRVSKRIFSWYSLGLINECQSPNINVYWYEFSNLTIN